VREALERWNRLDVLINNVGIFPEAPFLELSLELWKSSFDVNLTSFFLFSQQAAREMVARGGGSIVNISSLDARNGVLNFASYAAAKAGVLGLTHTLALELGPMGIRVNAVCPGIVETDMTRQRIAANRDGYLSKIPLRRIGRPEDIAEVVAFLASPAAGYVTGQAINVNGGWRFD
jgi:3-oxoacyl-[acyl-carrier protein] reductase